MHLVFSKLDPRCEPNCALGWQASGIHVYIVKISVMMMMMIVLRKYYYMLRSTEEPINDGQSNIQHKEVASAKHLVPPNVSVD